LFHDKLSEKLFPPPCTTESPGIVSRGFRLWGSKYPPVVGLGDSARSLHCRREKRRTIEERGDHDDYGYLEAEIAPGKNGDAIAFDIELRNASGENTGDLKC